MKESLRTKVLAIISEDQILYNEPMSLHTTFRVGGMADTLLIPGNEKEAVALLRLFSVAYKGNNLAVIGIKVIAKQQRKRKIIP